MVGETNNSLNILQWRNLAVAQIAILSGFPGHRPLASGPFHLFRPKEAGVGAPWPDLDLGLFEASGAMARIGCSVAVE
jgi:hypothetical protein